MNTELIHALQIVRYECTRAMDAAQLNQPISPRLSTALSMLDEELSSESYRQRVQAQKDEAAPADELALAAYHDARMQRRLTALNQLRNSAVKLGYIDENGNPTPYLEEITGISLVRHSSDSSTDLPNEGEPG